MDLSLYVITARMGGLSHIDVARAAVEGGATVVQFREKELPREACIDQAVQVRDVCRDAGVSFVVNDDPGLAMELDADGFHIGQDDLAALEMWKPRHPAFLGISVTDPVQVEAAIASGADYLGAGPAFATSSKDDAASPMGLAGLTEVVERSTVPVVAIGGISEETVCPVIETGVDGVCVISAVAMAPDPTAAVCTLKTTVDQALKGVNRT